MTTSLQRARYLMALANGPPEKVPTGAPKGEEQFNDVKRGAVLHIESAVVGYVAGVYLPGEYTSPVNNAPVQAHVLELDGGHTFCFDGEAPIEAFEGQFRHLTIRETHFLLMSIGGLDVYITGSATLGHAMRLDFDIGQALVVASLERALRALKTSPTPEKGTPPAA